MQPGQALAWLWRGELVPPARLRDARGRKPL